MLVENASTIATNLPQMPTMRINDNPATLKEIKDAITALPNNKAAEIDDLPAMHLLIKNLLGK